MKPSTGVERGIGPGVSRRGCPSGAAGSPAGMRVVVIGGSGNAGVALLRALEPEERIEEVVAVARRVPGDWPSAKVTWRSLDITRDAIEP